MNKQETIGQKIEGLVESLKEKDLTEQKELVDYFERILALDNQCRQTIHLALESAEKHQKRINRYKEETGPSLPSEDESNLIEMK